jgi:hypothetical protein
LRSTGPFASFYGGVATLDGGSTEPSCATDSPSTENRLLLRRLHDTNTFSSLFSNRTQLRKYAVTSTRPQTAAWYRRARTPDETERKDTVSVAVRAHVRLPDDVAGKEQVGLYLFDENEQPLCAA